ncbi:MAG: hypothetical protein A2293_01335 [Elusimicrobia bacterium RIFOXYB2_FULL_49_7]|nr:MAG: hypothetical protein A2293_01335 [Elusimicrobia bacterium RIFOXYB2_FULL_49_7]
MLVYNTDIKDVKSELTVFRLYFLIIIIANPVFSLIFRRFFVESMPQKLVISAIYLAILFLSYKIDFIRRRLFYFFYYLSFLSSFQIGYLLIINNYSPVYYMSLFLFNIWMSLTIRTYTQLLIYQIVSFTVLTVSVLMLPNPFINKPIIIAINTLMHPLLLFVFIIRMQNQEKLDRLLSELNRSNMELKEIVHISSHHLQEPQRMIVSYLQLIERQYKNKIDEKGKEYFGYAVDGAIWMKQLIQDLVTYTNISQQYKNSLTQINGEAILLQVIGSTKATIEQCQAIITHDPLPILMADEKDLTLLLYHLISNSLKFHGQETPQIHISAQNRKQNRKAEWVFSIRDNGIGIAQQHYERIFKIFEKLHPRSEFHGTGIGLPICRKIVERYRGEIWIESEEGKGSTFFFTIPIQ